MDNAEMIDGAEVMRKWLAIPVDKRSVSVESQRRVLSRYPSPDRAYQSAMEALSVLNELGL